MLKRFYAYRVAEAPEARTASVGRRLFRATVFTFQREIHIQFTIQISRLGFSVQVCGGILARG